MKLSAPYLLESLKAYYQLTECNKLPDHFCLERPVFYLKGMSLKKETVYVLCKDVPEGPSLPPDSLVLGVETLPGIEELPPESLCLFPPETSCLELFNRVQEIFDRMDKWDQTLRTIQTEEGSIQKLLEVSYPIFQNPMIVQNLDFSVVTSCHAEELRQNAGLHTQDKMELINSLKQDSLYNKFRDWDEVFCLPEYLTGYRSLNLNIKRYGHTAFRILLVEKEHPFRQCDFGLLKYFGYFVEYALLHNVMKRPSNSKTLHNIFLNLLSNRGADYMSISRQLSREGWSEKHSYLCMLLVVTYLDRQNLTANAICEYMENVISHSCAFSFKDNIVVYVDMNLFGGSVEDITEKLVYFLRNSFLKLSLSYQISGHMYLRKQYLQALAAHNIGNTRKPHLWIHSFEDFALPYLFQKATREIPGPMLCHTGLLRLQLHDKEQGTEYTKTLRTYLDNHLNAVQSAKELFIHRSTFLYRMEKIRAILDSSLEDPEEILHLMISYRLLQEDKKQEIASGEG